MQPRLHSINLKLNTQEVAHTDLIVVQYDNKSVEFNFKITNVEGEYIDYAHIEKATMISKMANGKTIECECTVGEAGITYLLCYDETEISGGVLSEISLYGIDQAHATTQKFQYIVIPTLAIGIDPSNESNLPILQDLINSVIKLENNTQTAESLRVLAEEIRSSNESLRMSNEISRIESEATRIQNEILRQETLVDVQSDIESINSKIVKITATSFCQMILYEVGSLEEGLLEEAIFKIPTGYDYDITDVTLISHGEATGITDENICEVYLMNDENFSIASISYNATNAFPSSNFVSNLTVEPDFITEGNIVKVVIENGVGVVTPKFLLQINYTVKLVE